MAKSRPGTGGQACPLRPFLTGAAFGLGWGAEHVPQTMNPGALVAFSGEVLGMAIIAGGIFLVLVELAFHVSKSRNLISRRR